MNNERRYEFALSAAVVVVFAGFWVITFTLGEPPESVPVRHVGDPGRGGGHALGDCDPAAVARIAGAENEPRERRV